MNRPDMAAYHHAYIDVEQTVAANDFSINHDIDGILKDVWEEFGHFDFEDIDFDQFWDIADNHEKIGH